MTALPILPGFSYRVTVNGFPVVVSARNSWAAICSVLWALAAAGCNA